MFTSPSKAVVSEHLVLVRETSQKRQQFKKTRRRSTQSGTSRPPHSLVHLNPLASLSSSSPCSSPSLATISTRTHASSAAYAICR